jgi:hypothetical protein
VLVVPMERTAVRMSQDLRADREKEKREPGRVPPSHGRALPGAEAQFVDPARGTVTAQLLVLGATQKVTGFLVLGATALASGAVGGWLARRPGFAVWQERFAGAMMVALGLRLLVTGARGGR